MKTIRREKLCMSNFSKRKGIIISLIISIVIWMSLYFILSQFRENSKKEVNSSFILKTSQTTPITKIETEEPVMNQYKNHEWRILIPKIHLDAPILEGTGQEILRRAVGHFETTSKWDGNVVLAAHNRGYKYNYFQEIKRLAVEDTIVYQTEQGTRTYSVIWKGKIQETDFSPLENTKENQLTLITCVENMPAYRMCVKAQQIETNLE